MAGKTTKATTDAAILPIRREYHVRKSVRLAAAGLRRLGSVTTQAGDGPAVNYLTMTRDANAVLRDALQLPVGERQELAARLLAQESAVVSADPNVMSGAPVFRGTRVLVQTLIEHLEAGDSIDDFLEGFPSVTREQVIAFLEETKARVLAYAE
jgi:uncharacterized protein (DUF433 family)